MKKIIYSVLFFVCLSINAQVFAPIGANWFYSSQNGGAAPTNSEYIHYESIKDSIVKGLTVRKIERKWYHYSGSISNLTPLFVYNSTDTAFIYNPISDKFDNLYIFNKVKGDTLTLDVPFESHLYSSLSTTKYRLVLDTVTIETHNGKSIKKYKSRALDGFQFWFDGWFMDYTGGLDYFFPRIDIIPEADGPLRCYTSPEFNIHFSTTECDYRLTSATPSVNFKNIMLYPNPCNNKFKITSNTDIYKVEIFNSNGVLIRRVNNYDIDISDLANGLYILKIQLTNKSILFEKLIKS